MSTELLDRFLEFRGEPASARRYPIWVRLSLYWPRTRGGQWFYFWLAAGLAVTAALLGLWFRDAFALAAVLVFTFGAVGDWLAIRWIDTNGSWAEVG